MEANPYEPPTIPAEKENDRPSPPMIYPSRVMRGLSVFTVVNALVMLYLGVSLVSPFVISMSVLFLVCGVIYWFSPARDWRKVSNR